MVLPAAAAASAAGVPDATSASRHASLLSVMKRRPGSERVHSSTRTGSTGAPVVRWRCSPTSPRSQPIPTAPGTELPPVVVDRRGVRELEPGAVGALSGQAHLDPAHAATELPRGAEPCRWFALLDGAARVSFELVPPTEPQVAGHRQEPARDPLRVRARVPHVVEVRCVRLRERHGAGLRTGRAHLPGDGSDLVVFIDHDVALSGEVRRARLPRASSVPSAASGGAQKRRNRSSHSSTSCRPEGSTA